MKRKSLLFGLLAMVMFTSAEAQKKPKEILKKPKEVLKSPRPNEYYLPSEQSKKLTWGSAFDAAIFSTSVLSKVNEHQKLTTLRFTYVINIGVNVHYDFTSSFGVYSGLNIKNIGFIEKIGDSTIKRRVYTIGIPLALKFGNMFRRNYFLIGGGVDVPFNYREKGFVLRGHKDKFDEWFSDRTPAFMPYFSAGFSIYPGIVFKFQYYPANFLNRDFVDNGVRVYSDYERTNLILLSIGADFRYRKQKHCCKEIKATNFAFHKPF